MSCIALVLVCADTAAGQTTCTPGTFTSTNETVIALDAAFTTDYAQMLDAIQRNPGLAPGASVTTTMTVAGVVQRTTLSRSAGGDIFSFEVDAALKSPTPAFVTVVRGQQVAVSASIPGGTFQDTQATLFVDETAKATFGRSLLRGKLSFTYELLVDSSQPAPGVQASLSGAFTNFMISATDPRGPRTGTYRHTGEPGFGLVLAFQASLNPFSGDCNPAQTADAIATAEVSYVAGDGTVHSRWDAAAMGSPIPAGDRWVTLQCTVGPSLFQMTKLEDASGNTVSGSASEAGSSPTLCDPIFVVVPSLTNNATDYDFTNPATSFPTEWTSKFGVVAGQTSAIGADGLTVGSVHVLVDGSTAFGGAGGPVSLQDVKVGDSVVVVWTRQTDGTLLALAVTRE